MKRCPECRRDYYDESLLYCLDDGTRLLDGPSTDNRTVIMGQAPVPSGDVATRFAASALKLTQITFSDAIEQYPDWAPDGEQVVFSREDAGLRSLYLKNLFTDDE